LATQIFAWGYVAWMTHQPSGYSLSGYIDGRKIDIVMDMPQEAERTFAQAARSAWLSRKFRVIRGLPAREFPPINSLDNYYGISLRVIVASVMTELRRRIFRRPPKKHSGIK
jgi:hypothetical protein